jgi:hypothetical protein
MYIPITIQQLLFLSLSCFPLLVDLNQPGAKDGSLCDRICIGKWPSAVGHNGNRQTVAEGSLTEWEGSCKGNLVALYIDILKLLDNRCVLLVDVDKRQPVQI